MSPLRDAVERYLETRRAFGFKLQRAASLLPDFVRHLEAHHAAFITLRLALDWAQRPPDGHPAWWAERLSLVRGLARHLQADDPRHQVPPVGLMPRRVRRASPVLFTASEIATLLRAARQLRAPLRAATYETLFGLLAVTGMRIGEAIRLERDDLDWQSQLLVVRRSKFDKSREVVLHSSVMTALRRYTKVRDACCPRPHSPAFFVSLNGTRLIYNNAHRTFRTLVRAAGIRSGRPHDLRHSFAVATLLRWYRTGVDVNARMPRLSTYLGHAAPESTYWYLTAAPELMAIARRRLERAGGLAS
jgi:integrase/recombinase XerD